MVILLYVVACTFGLMGLGLLSGFAASKHVGLLLAGLVFLGAAVVSILLMSWWPFPIAFILAWILRLLGLDPGARG